jgi:beta-glucosidase
VLTVSPGPFLTDWRESVASIVDLGFPGEQEGNAAVDILFGVVNPGGKLPHTMPNVPNEMKMTQRQYPGIAPPPDSDATLTTLKNGTRLAAAILNCGDPIQTLPSGLNPKGGTGGSDCIPTKAYYDEKLLVGYRWYDQHKVTPAFEFGHGMSYTSFKYTAGAIDAEDLKCTKTSCTFTVSNTGTVAGSEVAQLYLSFPVSAGEPPKQLKAFQKVQLAAGAKKVVILELTPRSFSIWSVETHAWTVVTGEFGVSVGGSSREVRLSTTLHVANGGGFQ